jgi:hypothetical protein
LPAGAVSLFAFGGYVSEGCVMRHRRSVSYKFEKKAQKARLEAQLAELNAQLAFLNKARMALLRRRIRQLDAEAAH